MAQDMQEFIDYIVRQRPFIREILNSYKSLVELMPDIDVSLPDLDKERQLQQLKAKEGFPVFPREALPIDPIAYSKTLSRIIGYLTHQETEEKEPLSECLDRMKEDTHWADTLSRAVLTRDHDRLTQIAREVGLQPERLYFLAKLALKPALEAIRSVCAGMVNVDLWDQGYCPLCGSEPNMAYLDKKGKRHLYCELCGQEWPYPRVNCPFCRNEDQKTLGYFHSDNEQGLRVDFCRKCQRYIKTVDRREFEMEVPMELEYLATLHLDILAEKEGFR